MQHLIVLFKKHWGAIVILSLMGAVAGLWLSLQQTPMYASNTRLLVLQKGVTSGDGYTTLRAAERMGQSLTHIMGTASFMDKMLMNDQAIDDIFPKDEALRRKIWSKMLQVSVLPDSSILDVTVLHHDRNRAAQVISAVSTVLIANGREYLGIENLNIQVVDAPLTSVTPVKPDVPLNIIMGLLIGFILSTGVTLLRELFLMNSVPHHSVELTPHPVHIYEKMKDSIATSVSPVKSLQPAMQSVPAAPMTPHTAKENVQIPSHSVPTEGIPPPTDLPFENNFEMVTALNEILTSSPAISTASSPMPTLPIKTMHDHVRAPFGGEYFFQRKLVRLDDV